jgi:hypothetical protein
VCVKVTILILIFSLYFGFCDCIDKTTPRIEIRFGEVFDLAKWLERPDVDAKSQQSKGQSQLP